MAIINDGLAFFDPMTLFWQLMALDSLGVGLLGGALWILALGGIATLAASKAGIRDGEPLPSRTRRGSILGAICAALLVPLAADDPRTAITLLLIVSTIALLIGRRWPGPRAFGATLLFLAVPVALVGKVGHTAARAQGAEAITGVSATLLAAMGHAVIGLIVPLVTALALALAALVRRVPISVGVVRGMARIAIPAAALLGILYAGSAVTTARADARLSDVLVRQTEHEGRFYADTIGKPWPE